MIISNFWRHSTLFQKRCANAEEVGHVITPVCTACEDAHFSQAIGKLGLSIRQITFSKRTDRNRRECIFFARNFYGSFHCSVLYPSVKEDLWLCWHP